MISSTGKVSILAKSNILAAQIHVNKVIEDFLEKKSRGLYHANMNNMITFTESPRRKSRAWQNGLWFFLKSSKFVCKDRNVLIMSGIDA